MLYKLHPNSRPITPTSIMVGSRRYVDLLKPDPADVDISDIAAGLDAPRYRNQTTVQCSIADHCLRTARLALAHGEPLEVVLACLLHDAPEGYLGDLPGPLKKHVRVELASGTVITWAELEALWAEAICSALFEDPLAEKVAGLINAHRGPVAQYDRMALRAEALLWMPAAEDWAEGGGDLSPSIWAAIMAPRGAGRWVSVVAEFERYRAADSAYALAILRDSLLGW